MTVGPAAELADTIPAVPLPGEYRRLRVWNASLAALHAAQAI